MSDFIIAHNIEVFCRIGCSNAERSFPQRLLVSARLGADTRKAAESLDLTHSVNYATVCDRVRELSSSRPWVLVEELAEKLTAQLLEEFVAVTQVHLHIKKFILPGVEWVGIEINRQRKDTAQ